MSASQNGEDIVKNLDPIQHHVEVHKVIDCRILLLDLLERIRHWCRAAVATGREDETHKDGRRE